MTTYASIKGHAARPAAQASTVLARPAADLPPAEIERISANRQLVMKHMPELVDFIKELHAVGLIDGWRCVQGCKLTNESTE